MEYLTIIGVAILVLIIVGFYMFYCRLNESNHRVEELKRTVRLLDQKEQGDRRQVPVQPQGQGQGQAQGQGQGQAQPQNQLGGGLNQVPIGSNQSLSPNQGSQGRQGKNNQAGQVGQKQNSGSQTQNHGSIIAEMRAPVSICANSEPSEESNNCTNYGPIPEEVDNVQLTSIDNMSEFPVDLLAAQVEN